GGARAQLLLAPASGPAALTEPHPTSPPSLLLQPQTQHPPPLQALDMDVADEALADRLDAVGGLRRARHGGTLPTPTGERKTQASAPRKSASRRLVASGCSSGATCPADGPVANCDPGMPAALARIT